MPYERRRQEVDVQDMIIGRVILLSSLAYTWCYKALAGVVNHALAQNCKTAPESDRLRHQIHSSLS